MQNQNNTVNDYEFDANEDHAVSQKPNGGAAMTENSFNVIYGARTKLFDADALLMFLDKEENLHSILNQDSPEVVLKSMIHHAANLVSEATGDTTAVIEEVQKAERARHE
ncbi:hypothetical protein QPM17_03690 [Marinobacter sp. TBZ242]|uniref:Uncharacterized protein n=1 Tax=Marinobacter azerbaijanicus TaxID=3050455 RepID=A0ABT7I7R7_9GAMM|nr:hypothetical protein [Marinobacter sp. TBZ242]MDL0430211.1 hypothetical protein [Marinobacter sp. TBZ242]